MALLTYQRATITGKMVTLANASAGGDTVAPSSKGMLMVKNGDSSAHNVTVVVPGNTQFAQPEPDVTVAVAAGATVLIGPLPAQLADPADGLVHVSYAATTSMQVAAVTL